MEDRTHYRAELDVLDGSGSIISVGTFYVHETPMGGWRGYVSIQSTDLDVSVEQIFNAVTAFRIMPGSPAALGLWTLVRVSGGASGAGSGGTDNPDIEESAAILERTTAKASTIGSPGPGDTIAVPLRTWPSVITDVSAGVAQPSGHALCHVRFADPLTYLGTRRIWGVFTDCSPGEMLGGAISLALNGSGRSTQAPSMAGLPPLLIHQNLRVSMRKLPYAIASGETLSEWAALLLARLGIRLELMGQDSGAVAATLRDHAPENRPVSINVNDGEPDAENLVLSRQGLGAGETLRDTLLDSPIHGPLSRVFGFAGVETLVSSSETDFDEASVRATFSADRSDLGLTVLRGVSGQPGFHPGRRVSFDNRLVNGSRLWQAGRVEHAFKDETYLNLVHLFKSGVAWRLPAPPQRGPRTLSGMVGNASFGTDEPVPRDELGRIPVKFAFQCEDGDAEASESEAPADAAETFISLAVRDPMAGGSHGFVPEHRQGDLCDITVHHPLHAEVSGFRYSESRLIGEQIADGTMGIIMESRPDDWSGLLFRPKEALEETSEENEGGASDGGEADPAPDE